MMVHISGTRTLWAGDKLRSLYWTNVHAALSSVGEQLRNRVSRGIGVDGRLANGLISERFFKILSTTYAEKSSLAPRLNWINSFLRSKQTGVATELLGFVSNSGCFLEKKDAFRFWSRWLQNLRNFRSSGDLRVHAYAQNASQAYASSDAFFNLLC